MPDHGFSKSALEISRSFRPRGRRWTVTSSVTMMPLPRAGMWPRLGLAEFVMGSCMTVYGTNACMLLQMVMLLCFCSLGGPAFAARAAAAANAVAAADAAACNGRNTSSSDVNSSFRATSDCTTPDDTVHNAGVVARNNVEDIDAAATLAI